MKEEVVHEVRNTSEISLTFPIMALIWCTSFGKKLAFSTWQTAPYVRMIWGIVSGDDENPTLVGEEANLNPMMKIRWLH